jgi:hypothetical protein
MELIYLEVVEYLALAARWLPVSKVRRSFEEIPLVGTSWLMQSPT